MSTSWKSYLRELQYHVVVFFLTDQFYYLDSSLVESELHDREYLQPCSTYILISITVHADQGATPRLSQFWMPLTEFTQKAMDGLLRGDMQIPVGVALDTWTKFEKPKLEAVAEQARRASQAK